MDLEDEWSNYITCQSKSTNVRDTKDVVQVLEPDENLGSVSNVAFSDLYISTKTKVLFINQPIAINSIFWNIPIVDYWKPNSGVIKKQMKIVSKDPAEYEELKQKLSTVQYYIDNVIKQIDNPTARRIKFKDERKITIGISRKDIINSRGKIKNAFYNCFAMILRFQYKDKHKEIHVKVFNTGKLEIPGIINTELLVIVKGMILDILTPHLTTPVLFIENEEDSNVLINSNFNCGFFINRDKLHTILRSEKYGIEAAYDPCSYPGVKCKFYFNNEVGFDSDKQNGKILPHDRNMKMSELIDSKKYTEVSFMIFRTGSGLIVGNCSDRILFYIFEFIKNILEDEYLKIRVTNEIPVFKDKSLKIKKRIAVVSNEYYAQITGEQSAIYTTVS
jgi:hypothetical protein